MATYNLKYYNASSAYFASVLQMDKYCKPNSISVNINGVYDSSILLTQQLVKSLRDLNNALDILCDTIYREFPFGINKEQEKGINDLKGLTLSCSKLYSSMAHTYTSNKYQDISLELEKLKESVSDLNEKIDDIEMYKLDLNHQEELDSLFQ